MTPRSKAVQQGHQRASGESGSRLPCWEVTLSLLRVHTSSMQELCPGLFCSGTQSLLSVGSTDMDDPGQAPMWTVWWKPTVAGARLWPRWGANVARAPPQFFLCFFVEEPGADMRRLPRQAATLKAALADARAAADGSDCFAEFQRSPRSPTSSEAALAARGAGGIGPAQTSRILKSCINNVRETVVQRCGR